MKESIKGFCRRQSQKVGQTYGSTDKTHDSTHTDLLTKYENSKLVNDKLLAAITTFLKNVTATTESLKDVRSALAQAQAVDKDQFVDEIRQLDIAYQEITTKLQGLEKGLRADAEAPIVKLKDQYVSIKASLDDREAKLLEFDFFRNKVSDLERNPPKDPERIPRNKAILEKWKKDYEEANNKSKATLTTMVDQTRVAHRGAIGSFFSTYNNYLSEAAATSRIVLRDIGGTIASAQQAVLNVLTTATNQTAQVVQSVTTTAAATLSSVTLSASNNTSGGAGAPQQPVATQQSPPPAQPPAPKDPFAFN
eukprot:PhF_6_TR35121/c0_g1_i1/m.51198